jgi:hypothetical protein
MISFIIIFMIVVDIVIIIIIIEEFDVVFFLQDLVIMCCLFIFMGFLGFFLLSRDALLLTLDDLVFEWNQNQIIGSLIQIYCISLRIL